MLFSTLSSSFVSPLAWKMKGIHLVYLSIQYLLLVRCIWGLFIITVFQAQYFPPWSSSRLLMFDEHKESWWGVATCMEFSVLPCLLFHPLLVLVAVPHYYAFSSGIPAVSGIPSPFRKGTFELDWIRHGKLGHCLWSAYCIAGVKVKPETRVFSQRLQGSWHFLFSCLYFFDLSLLCKMYFHWVFHTDSFRSNINICFHLIN